MSIRPAQALGHIWAYTHTSNEACLCTTSGTTHASSRQGEFRFGVSAKSWSRGFEWVSNGNLNFIGNFLLWQNILLGAEELNCLALEASEFNNLVAKLTWISLGKASSIEIPAKLGRLGSEVRHNHLVDNRATSFPSFSQPFWFYWTSWAFNQSASSRQP